jgi:hypothetical protein
MPPAPPVGNSFEICYQIRQAGRAWQRAGFAHQVGEGSRVQIIGFMNKPDPGICKSKTLRVFASRQNGVGAPPQVPAHMIAEEAVTKMESEPEED